MPVRLFGSFHIFYYTQMCETTNVSVILVQCNLGMNFVFLRFIEV